ncbi:MAG: hypothetical protein PHI84_22155 [Kiritimatiellae bacterium]|nr:hypothetical protein [Kiritimatiellia bacterium]
MNEKSIVLAAMAPAKSALHTPVQVQKLLFLIDKEIPDLVEGPHFSFRPYDYGPFDSNVYDVLEQLQKQGLANIIIHKWRNYQLTENGQEEGTKILKNLDKTAQQYISEASLFVRRLSFNELVSAIYKAYPEMRANSVFQG